MCVWNRIHLLKHTLDLLENQVDKDFDLYLWNNNINYQNQIDNIIHKKHSFKTEVTHYPQNIGGVGRFYMANQISDKYDYVVFIDDDQHFDENLVKIFREESDSKTISGWWAYKTNKEYFNRKPLQIGEEGDYIGTGGMVCPIEPFTHPELFDNFPKKYLFLEDIWLTHFCKNKLGYSLKKSRVNINFIPNEIVRDQSHDLGELKSEFYNYLNK